MGIFSNDEFTSEFWRDEGFQNLSRSSEAWIKWEYKFNHWINIKVYPSRVNGYILKYTFGKANTNLYSNQYHIDDKVDWEVYKGKIYNEFNNFNLCEFTNI